jgi:replication factor C subunit 3/5
MAEDAVAAMEVDEPQQAAKLTAAVKGKGKIGVASQQQFTGGPWVEKYRPASLADVAAHRDIIDTSTGKTSTILAVARKLYGSYYQNMILELNASDDRGIDVVRQQVQDFASTQSISFGPKINVKLVILDEADAMTKEAQFSLRRIIEKYTKNTRFCLICNYVSKIIPALQSRCTRFRFPPLAAAHVTDRLRYIIQQEK